MRILGVDPSLQCTGYGLIEAGSGSMKVLEGGVIRTDASLSLDRRLLTLYEGIAAVMREFAPEHVVVEELYSKYEHPRTAILMGHARGTVLLAAATLAIPYQGYEASLVKKSITGNGRATKGQVAGMVCKLLDLAEPPSPDDVTDALALAVCHASPLRGNTSVIPSRRRPPLEFITDAQGRTTLRPRGGR
jgi:crossover junction endodeoxyribonuclease RuvC